MGGDKIKLCFNSDLRKIVHTSSKAFAQLIYVTKLLNVPNFHPSPLRRIGYPFYLRTTFRKNHFNATLYYIHQTDRVRIIAPPEQWFLR
jgi:hypothetical protein